MAKVVKQVKSELIFPIIKEILDTGKSTRITVTGLSMYPFLREHIDSVELSNTSFINIHRGDIVMILRDSNEYVMHRVYRKEIDCFYIVGDAQQWIEGPLRPDQLVAIIIAVWRENKRIECINIWWRLLSSVWLLLLPLRCFIIRTYPKIRKLI
ncbi:hypothetical protein CPJCM30710_13960 [Clostridium polyendosporum]|uniref:Peptidase S24-like n=1 Tax=Clostridium polyendosporum TaxID=69208 RepID=A0A919RY88_9CLOT|nr:S24/S26 family peptidase [Clostridium polyendosporum]GIM28730.1 hypothetical protein CPJCM30710_13960 [Clostridium polyendosporum]